MIKDWSIDPLMNAFRVPFHGLGLVVWVFFVWSFLIYPDATFFKGMFIDSDDLTHFIRVIDWLEGQSWFDPIIYRMAPSEGVATHFSRLAELPLAAMLWPLHQLGMSWIGASYVVGAIYPFLMFGLFLVAVCWVAEFFVGADWARSSAYVSLFAAAIVIQFSMGRVDHHGLAAILVLVAFGAILRLMREPSRLKWALIGGAFFGLAQSIALETLPWMLLMSAWLGLWLIVKGQIMARASVVFGASFFISSALALAACVLPSAYFDVNLLSFSYPFVLLSALMGVVFVLSALASFHSDWRIRGSLALLAAIVFGGLFLTMFPELVLGPYGAMDPRLADLFFKNISEAVPLVSNFGGWTWKGLATMGLLLPGFVAVLLLLSKENGQRMWEWLFCLLLITAAVYLSLFYECRVFLYVSVFSIFPLTAALKKGWEDIGRKWQGRRRAAAELGLILLIGPLFIVFFPALVEGRTFNKGVLLFLANSGQKSFDADVGLWFVLNDKGYYGDRPRLIMNTINEGSEILFHTQHSILAAPYHTNVRGNLESYAFFSSTDMNEAKAIVKRTKAELVLLSKKKYSAYSQISEENKITETEQNRQQVKAQKFSFETQLIEHHVPDWLKPVLLPGMGEVLLYEVKTDLL